MAEPLKGWSVKSYTEDGRAVSSNTGECKADPQIPRSAPTGMKEQKNAADSGRRNK